MIPEPRKFFVNMKHTLHTYSTKLKLILTFASMQGLTSHLALAIAAGAIGSSFQHGYNTGVVNAPQKLVAAFINETYHERFQIYPDSSTIDLIYSLMVSIFCVGGMVGALATAYVAEKFGRKGGLLY